MSWLLIIIIFKFYFLSILVRGQNYLTYNHMFMFVKSIY